LGGSRMDRYKKRKVKIGSEELKMGVKRDEKLIINNEKDV
jgi:hypothetical protein